MRGFGDSALITSDTPPYSSSADLYHLLRFLQVEKTYVVGLSAGGALAIDFTIEHPEMVDALIPAAAGLMGYAPPSGEDLWPQIFSLLQQGKLADAVELNLRYWTDGPERTPQQIDARARERVRRMTTANYQLPNDPNKFMPQPMQPPAGQRLSEITVPTLIIYGDKDAKEVLETQHVLETGIKGAKSVVIPNTAHHLNMEQPAAFNQIVLDFLASLPRN
jgi:pimeloyl-ACP methyl ester carboxylesterase